MKICEKLWKFEKKLKNWTTIWISLFLSAGAKEKEPLDCEFEWLINQIKDSDV